MNTKIFNKQNIMFLSLAILNLGLCLFLTITIVPDQIATSVDFNEKIIELGSKWLLSINIFLPLVLSILILILHKNESLSFFFKSLIVLMLYENMLTYCYVCLETNFEIGTLCQIPLAASVFMPISVLIAVLSFKIKHVPYKSKFVGIRTKYTRADEFIWKHTHFVAKDVFFATGVILFLINIVFLFVRLAYIPLAIFVVAITVDIVIITHQSRLMYKKFIDMKKRQEKMENKSKENTEK